MNSTVDPRARLLAQRRQDIAHEESSLNRGWKDLTQVGQDFLLREAAEWLRAAVEAGLVPLADRPSDEHDAVLLDDYGQLWGEYQTSPPSYGDAILPLVLAAEQCSSKRELEDRGVAFRLIGWSQ